jgi:hypothetical protein
MATVKTDSLILVVVLRQNEGYTADVSSYLGLFLDASSEVLWRQGFGPAYFCPHRLVLG